MNIDREAEMNIASPSLSEKKSLMFRLLEELYEEDQIFIEDVNRIVEISTGMSLSELLEVKK